MVRVVQLVEPSFVSSTLTSNPILKTKTMKIENTIRNKLGQTESIVADQLSKDIEKLYKKHKSSNIDFDSFHLLICDLSSINRTMSITIMACNELENNKNDEKY